MQLNRDTSGVYIIAATPFDSTGELDIASLRRLVDFYREKGVSGITILGMMGEADKLSPEEQRKVVDTVIGRAQELPVVVGVSAPGLKLLADLGRYAMDRGAAGLMIAPNRAQGREDRVEAYFRSVCEAVGGGVPIVFQDFPLSTGVSVSPALIRRLSTDVPQIVMLKHEDWPGLAKITALREQERETGCPRISILCGNGGLYLPQELARGADGAMTGFAYPEALVQTVALHHAGETERAEDVFDAYLPLLRHEQQPGFGLAARKHTLMRRGAIACDATRSPGPKLTGTDVAELERLRARMEKHIAAISSGVG